MLAFLLKRLLNAAFVVLAIALLAFMIFRFFGDPVERMVNEHATQSDRVELCERLGLNDSLPVQYNAVQGDFGMSYRNQQDVMVLIAERFPATFKLVIVATVLSLVIGIPLGVLTAVYRDSRLADTLQLGSIIGVSLPIAATVPDRAVGQYDR